jgi:anti-anti-sigma regulatory factor
MTKLSFDGEFTVSNAGKIKRRIAEALESGGGIEMRLDSISDIDLAGLQLLVATVKECDARSVGCVLSGALPRTAIARAEDAGFVDGPIATDGDLLILLRAYT